MKIRSVGYYIKQGIKNIFRNKVMSLASISTVMAALLILGIFSIVVVNVNYIMKENVESGIQVIAYLDNEITDDQKYLIETEMDKELGVVDVEYESKQEALDNLKEQLGDKGYLVEGIDAEETMSMSYIITMENPRYVEGVVEKLKSMEGVSEVEYGEQYVNRLIQVTDFVKVLGLGLMAILFVVSVFLISNTIKLTVIARRREISIMKYIGATNWFIRWPFVIEGVSLGLIGAALSSVIVGYGYTVAADSVSKGLSIIKLIEPMEILPDISIMFVAIGIVLGFLGSSLSMRKFLNV